MLEQLRHTRERLGPGGADDIFAPVDNPALVTVSSGHHVDPFPVAGMTVAAIRRRLRDRLDIDPQAEGFINGRRVADDTVVSEGQVLTFIRHAGEKGSGRSTIRGLL